MSRVNIISPLVLEPVPWNGKMRVHYEYKVQVWIGDLESHTVTVEKGFVTDGASVPRMFWEEVFPPFHPQVIYAAVAHDWMYAHPKNFEKSVADKIFRELLLWGGVSEGKAEAAYLAVKMFGGIVWDKRLGSTSG